MDHDKIESVLKRLKNVIRSNTRLDDSLAIEAADDLISSLRTECDNYETRIVDLEEALEPFGTVAEAIFEKYETAPGEFREAYCDKPNEHEIWGFNRAYLTYGHFRAARAALKPKD